MAEGNTEANERTEDPTPRRLEEARRRGDVVKSMEVNTWFAIAGGTLMIMLFAGPMALSLQTTFRGLIAKSYQIPTDGRRCQLGQVGGLERDRCDAKRASAVQEIGRVPPRRDRLLPRGQLAEIAMVGVAVDADPDLCGVHRDR